MSERRIKAVAAALGPKMMDLTQYRRRSTRDGPALKVNSEVAAGALAFAARDNPAGPALLRFKYADQHNRAVFVSALERFLRRHRFYEQKAPSVTMHGCAAVAIFEWANDQCPDCRKGKRQRARGGLRCVTCNNSGRKDFKFKQRFGLVNDYVTSAGAAPLKLKTYSKSWDRIYQSFLKDLRDVDRAIAAGIDLGYKQQENRATMPEPRDLVAEPAEGEPERAQNAPGLAEQEPTGELPP